MRKSEFLRSAAIEKAERILRVGIAPACLPGIVDTQIANAIDEHLRAIDRLCRFGIDGGFGKKHPVKEY